MTKVVLYWDGIYGNEALLKEHQSTIQKLINGEYDSAHLDLKKSPGHRVYSAWTKDKAGRLLFTTVETKKHGRCLLLLDVVENHDYHKSPFLKPGVLNAFLEKNADQLIQEAIVFEEYNQPLFETKSNVQEELVASPMSFYKQEFIAFNLSQQEATEASLPLLITGCAGSGKTCVAFSLIECAIRDGKKRIIYLTQSQALVSEMEKQWASHPASQLADDVEVSFKTYQTLLLELHPELKEHKSVGVTECLSWLKRHKKQFPCGLDIAENLYQEFRILSAYDEKTYLNLGKKQSLITNLDHKAWLFKAYTQYQNHLKKQKQYDSSLFHLTSLHERSYDFVVGDEMQDFSHLQLKQAKKLATNNQIAYCADSHQSLHDIQSKMSYLRELTQPNKTIELPGSYRCPAAIIQGGNHILALKYLLTGGLSDKEERANIVGLSNEKEGSLQWIDFNPKESSLPECGSNFVVITLSKHKDEAKKRFNTPLVFTVDEYKGLEFPNVVLYQLLDETVFEKASKLLSVHSLDEINSDKTIHRSKNEAGDKSFFLPFNKLYTAFTRTTGNLIFIQEKTHALESLINLLKQGMPSLNKDALCEKIEPSWEDTLKDLIKNNCLEQAKGVYVGKLQRAENTFSDYCDALLNNDKPAVVIPKTNTNEIKPVEVPVSIKSQKTRKQDIQPSPKQNKEPIKSNVKKEVVKITSPVKTNDTLVRVATEKERSEMLALCHEKGIYKNRMTSFLSKKGAELLLFLSELQPEHKSFYNLIVDKSIWWSNFCSLFFENKKLLNLFTPELLCRPLDIETMGVKAKNTSILNMLSASGVDLLHWFWSNNKQFFKTLDPIVLFKAVLTTGYGQSAATGAPLNHLSITSKGRIILNYLITENSAFAKELTVDLLRVVPIYQFKNTYTKEELHQISESDDIESANTTFFNLSRHQEGIEFLIQLFSKNPALIQSLRVEDLCRPCNPEFRKHQAETPLYFLASTDKGRQLLRQIFSADPELVQAIPYVSWALPPQQKGNKYGAIETLIQSKDATLLDLIPKPILDKATKKLEKNYNPRYFSSSESEDDSDEESVSGMKLTSM